MPIKPYFIKAYLHGVECAHRLTHRATCAPPIEKITRNIPYGPGPKQTLDVIQPLGQGPHPILIYIHGGGWIAGDKRCATPLCRILASRGYLVVNTNYRLAPRHRFPAAPQDIATVVHWAATNAHTYNGDPSNTFIAGDSAGAHLAAWHAAATHDPALPQSANVQLHPTSNMNIRALLLFYGLFDTQGVIDSGFPSAQAFVDAFIGPPPHNDRATPASPIRHINGNFPPCYLCAGAPDPLAVESQSLAAKLDALSVPRDSTIFTNEDHPNSTHGFINYLNRPCTRLAIDQATEFLVRHTTNPNR